MAYTKDYWRKRGAEILETRRSRYANDPEYRDKVREQARLYREKRREAKEVRGHVIVIGGKSVEALTLIETCESINITEAQLKYYRRKEYVPKPLVSRPVRLYTPTQAAYIQQLAELMKNHSTDFRRPKSPGGTVALTALWSLVKTIKENWKA